MSPRRDRNKSGKRDHGGHGRNERGENGSYGCGEVWTEHVSSSGKKYYYNSLLGISQWDRPGEWAEAGGRRPEQRESGRPAQHAPEVQVLHDTDTSSGGSTPVQEPAGRVPPPDPAGRAKAPHELPVVSALPRNLSHQLAGPGSALNHCAPSIHADAGTRHTPLNVLLSKSKIEGIQNAGAYGNFTQSESPMLSPSLSKYVSNDLVKHVTGWPAEVLERQAQKYSDEAYTLGDLQCMRVCTELKCARAVVRHMEIKATLQDQKIMYLRQQIESIKEVKSQNSIISNDL